MTSLAESPELKRCTGAHGCGEMPNGKRLAVDHDHETVRVRGLLCWICNTNIGRWNDSVETLASAIRYLEAT